MRNIYLAQVNNTYGRNAFLPYSVGLLQAYSEQDQTIRESYTFRDLFYLREDIEQVVSRVVEPDVFGISCYIWNWRYSTALAKAIRERFPDCLIVLGGPHVPVKSQGFFQNHPYADVLVHYEGEVTFHDLLIERLNDKPDYNKVDGISFQLPSGETQVTAFRPRLDNLSAIPSPYLTGVFDEIIKQPYDFHASQETNRGCPYSCTFCDWGSNILAKVKKFDQDRLMTEIDWFADHKIDLLYNCDANYGIFSRDIDLTHKMAEVKHKTGFPNKFRAAYAKNSNDTVFEIATILHQSGMNKGITLSFQSMNEKTLEVIKRKNIKINDFNRIIQRYRSQGIATYSEFIIGLPEETYDSFADGLCQIISSGQHDSLQVYTCEVLPNSEMNNPDYRAKYGIVTSKTPVLFFHGTPVEDKYQEEYELVVETSTLSGKDWIKTQVFSWAIQHLHCLGLTQVLAVVLNQRYQFPYRTFYESLIGWGQSNPDSILGQELIRVVASFESLRKGRPWGYYDRRFGDIIWPLEEAAFLNTVTQKAQFYREIKLWLSEVMAIDQTILDDLLLYQSNIVMCPDGNQTMQTRHNIKEVAEAAYLGHDVEVQPVSQTYLFESKKYEDIEQYAKEVVWYGRKGGRFQKSVRTLENATCCTAHLKNPVAGSELQ